LATTFDDIYNLNEAIMTDYRLSSLPENLFYYVLSQYLSHAISLFTPFTLKDLTQKVNFSQEIFEFTGDGTTKDFVLSPAPATGSGYAFFVSLGGVENTDFTYSELTSTLSFTNAPALDSAIYIAYYIVGNFTIDLDIEEQAILADAMAIPFTKSNVLNSKQLRQMISAAPVSLTSQANHNKVIFDGLSSLMDDLLIRMKRYSYTSDPDDLSGMLGEANW